VDSPGPADFPAKLQSKAQSKDMPDLYSTIDANLMAPYYKAGWARDLTADLDGEWGKTFTPSALKLVRFEDDNSLKVPAGTYSICWDTVALGMLADPAPTGIDVDNPPATMPDFLAAVAKAGDGKFSIAASLTPSLIQSYATNYMTDAEIDATFSGKASWETDAWRKTFQVLADLRDAGALANNSIPGGKDDNPNVEKAFFNSKTVASIFDGSPAVGVARTTAPDFTTYVSIPVPAAKDATQKARGLAKPGKCAAINPKGKHVDQSLAFAKWLTAPEQQKVFAEKVGTIPTAASLAEAPASDQTKGFATAAGNAMIVPNTMTTDVTNAIGSGAQSIVLNEKSVDDVLKAVQSAQDASK
jgi:ABC-type glycerol-3-phosphate transport system substrate-binding protein